MVSKTISTLVIVAPEGRFLSRNQTNTDALLFFVIVYPYFRVSNYSTWTTYQHWPHKILLGRFMYLLGLQSTCMNNWGGGELFTGCVLF